MLVRRSLTPLLVASLLLALAGSGATLGVAHAAGGVRLVVAPPQVVSAAAGTTAWKLDAPVVVKVTGGTLTAVTLTGRDGRAVRGGGAPAAPALPTTWTSTGTLAPRTTYVLDATAVGPDGQQAVLHSTVRTGAPPAVLHATISPNGRSVGVGRPLIVTFDHAVRRRADVEAALQVTTSKNVGPASWSWTSSRTIQYRPQHFWPAYTRVTVTSDLRKVHAGPGLWGMKDTGGAFRIDRAFVMRVSNIKHRLTLTRNGIRIRTFGVSLGKPGFPTRSGTKVIMEKYVSHRMNSITVGITGAEAYDLDVPYAMRITSTGEFLHGAPWNPYVGIMNHSHGCTNLTLASAHWLFDHVLEGDPVVTTGTGRPTESWNGLGGGWNLPWATWVAGSALS